MGLKYLVYTDIIRDGMLKGVNIEEAIEIARESNLLVIASGGVSDINDIKKLKSHEKDNIIGVIIGQAIYKGTVDLKEAIEIGSS